MTTLDIYRSFLKQVDDPVAAAILTLAERVSPTEERQDAALTVAEAAKWLGCSDKTIYTLCSVGLLRHNRVGKGRGSIRITRDDLELYRRSSQG